MNSYYNEAAKAYEALASIIRARNAMILDPRFGLSPLFESIDKARAIMGPQFKKPSDLDAMVKDAMDRFNAMTPEQRAEHRRAQRKSWVVGEMMLSHPDMTREEAERLYDEIV